MAMKHPILAFGLFFTSLSAVAQSGFDGFYAQIGIGYESAKATSSNSQQVLADNPSNIMPITSTIGTINTFTQNIGIGYTAKLTDKFFLGIGADYNPLESQSANFALDNISSGGSSNSSYLKTNTYNIFLSPGYAFSTSSLGYVKIGYSSTQLKLTAGSDSIAPGQVDRFNLNGYVLGAGYKQFIMKNLYAFTEANYTSYSSTNTTSISPYGGTISTMSGKVGLNSYNLLVGLGYKF
jgi:outer membrane immunogenic protein